MTPIVMFAFSGSRAETGTMQQSRMRIRKPATEICLQLILISKIQDCFIQVVPPWMFA
jgi:hypothetical protein